MTEADDPSRLADRLQALEALVAFMLATRHYISPDPATAPSNVKNLLIDQIQDYVPGKSADELRVLRNEITQVLDRAIHMQTEIPKRLVEP